MEDTNASVFVENIELKDAERTCAGSSTHEDGLSRLGKESTLRVCFSNLWLPGTKKNF